MSFFSFKTIKLFKSSGIPPTQEEIPPSLPKEENLNLWQKLVRNPFIFLFLFVLVLAWLISYLPSKTLTVLREGEIAPSDIIAPQDITIQDTETTEKRKKEAEEAVLPVYFFDQNVFLNTEEKIRGFFNFGRTWLKATSGQPRNLEELEKNISDQFEIEISFKDLSTLIKISFPSGLEDTLANLIGKVSGQGIIPSKNLFIHKEQERGFILIKTQEPEKLVKFYEILDIKEGKELIAAEIGKLALSSREKSLLTSLSDLFLSPNITYNKVETEARKERARAAVETVFYTIKKGKVIIRKGDEANAEAIKLIRIINQNIRTSSGWFANFLGTFLLFALLLITLWYYLKSELRSAAGLKIFKMMGLTLILSLLLYRLSAFLASTFSQNATMALLTNREAYFYAFAFQLGVLIFAFLTTNHIALVYAILNSLLVGYLSNGNFYLMIFSLIGGLAAIYGIKYYQRQRRTSTLRAGLFLVAPINVFVVITIHLLKEKWGALDFLFLEAFMGIIGGGLSAALSFLFLPIYETAFGFITQTKLLEWTNSDLPVFRQLALEAPGSYHHSLVVATLAEKAAEEIKLDPMLVKAGALYHDIGKIKMPEYFIENATANPDLHKDLTPSMSTLVIINHVKEGVELAKKLKLPLKIREIIEQHHGNSLVMYFYQKAKEKYDPEQQKIGEESYRYPGPTPRSKEAALVMLADSVEAASRSLKSPTRENLKRVITEIFNNYLQDGQLDNCEFSLKEMRAIANSFLSNLYSIYHPRVQYPGFDFEMKKERKNNRPQKNNDRNPKSTA